MGLVLLEAALGEYPIQAITQMDVRIIAKTMYLL